MHDSKLITLFRTCSADERRRFRKWLASPFFNANKTLIQFFDFLDSRSDWTAVTLKKQRAFEFLFKNEPFDDLKLRRLLSEFLAQLEAFLAHESVAQNPILHRLALARSFRERSLADSATRHSEAAAARLVGQPKRNAQFFLESYRLEEERFHHAPAADRGGKSEAAATTFQTMTEALTRFFVAETLRNACTARSHQAVRRVGGEGFQIPFLEAILTACEEGEFDGVTAIEIWFHAFRCLAEPTQLIHFQQLKSKLGEAETTLDASELRGVFLLAINYCIRRLNTDDLSFVREVFDLYRLGLEKNVFLEAGFLSRFTFKNIVAAALKLGETDWTEAFIQQFSPKLEPACRASYERFCRAKLAFDLKNYDATAALLHDLEFDDVFLNLDARVMLLKIWFERREWRLLGPFLETFRRFVSRKKMLAYHGSNYQNLILMIEKLMLFQMQMPAPSDEMRLVLKKEIEEMQPLTEREWLRKVV